MHRRRNTISALHSQYTHVHSRTQTLTLSCLGDAVQVLGEAALLAQKECITQFRFDRWNCTLDALQTKTGDHTQYNTFTIQSQYTHNTLTIHLQYTHNTLTIHSQYTHNTLTIHSQYTHNTLTIHSQYTNNTLTIHSSLTIYSQYTRSTLTVHSQYTHN